MQRLSDEHYNWLHCVQVWLDGQYEKQFEHVEAPRLSFDVGPKYVRVVADRGAQRSVFCFLDKQGNILKADSWKRPAKYVRGHITDPNHSIGKGIGQYGAAYLR